MKRINKKNFLIFILVMFYLLILVSCNRNSVLELRREENNSYTILDEESLDDDSLDYGQAIYSIHGGNSENKISISLNTFKDGKIDQLFLSEEFMLERSDKILLRMKEDELSVYLLKNGEIRKLNRYNFERQAVGKNMNAWYWLDKAEILPDKGTIIFAAFSKNGENLPAPDLNLIDIEEWFELNKDMRVIFLKIS